MRVFDLAYSIQFELHRRPPNHPVHELTQCDKFCRLQDKGFLKLVKARDVKNHKPFFDFY